MQIEIDRAAEIVAAVQEKLAGPRWVWLVRYDTDSNDAFELYEDEEMAVESLIDYLETYYARGGDETVRKAACQMVYELQQQSGDYHVSWDNDYFSIKQLQVQSRSAKSSPRNDA